MSYANYLRAGVRDTKKPADAGFFRIFARGYLDFCPRVFGFLPEGHLNFCPRGILACSPEGL